MSETCRSCDAEVIFVPSAKSGKAMILDAKPGRGVVLVAISGQVLRGDPGEPPAEATVVPVYTDHHATCPKAADWKGRRR